MHKYPVGVLGASGYAGQALCALAHAHPRLELAWAAAHEHCGERMPFGGRTDTYLATEDAPLADAALVFSALPHGTSAPWVRRAQAAGVRVVDLSADLRPDLSDAADPGRCTATYGLPELARDDVRRATVVANPGCYATAVLLGLLPILERGLVAPGSAVVIDAASGVSGAGHSPRRDLLFTEVTENFRAYSVGNTHRHLAEMRAVCARLGADADLVFTPHLLPVARGILATITVVLAESVADSLALWRAYYAGEPFVEITPESPALHDVVYRNVARISVVAVAHVRRPTIIITAAIDNLLKGAAGQALQNANLILGLDEPLGLPA